MAGVAVAVMVAGTVGDTIGAPPVGETGVSVVRGVGIDRRVAVAPDVDVGVIAIAVFVAATVRVGRTLAVIWGATGATAAAFAGKPSTIMNRNGIVAQNARERATRRRE